MGQIEGYWPGAPDLAVEVLSPGDTCREVEAKVREMVGVRIRNRFGLSSPKTGIGDGLSIAEQISQTFRS